MCWRAIASSYLNPNWPSDCIVSGDCNNLDIFGSRGSNEQRRDIRGLRCGTSSISESNITRSGPMSEDIVQQTVLSPDLNGFSRVAFRQADAHQKKRITKKRL